jgi:nanoRNase/pAp phosphatase (c-di-AMP/oligoRNAs hydrolase)
MQQTTTPHATRSDDLLEVLSNYSDILIVAHDNPDPDAIATGWGVYTLIEEKLGRKPRLVGGGAIIRAENRHMLELLQPPIELVNEISCEEGTAAILVDCGLGTTNHLVTRAGIQPVAVIDHHLTGSRCAELPFRDVRPGMAASASIAASYLREQGIEPGEKLATAMLYAVRAETRGNETGFSRLDRAIVLWLTERADPSLLAEIENAPLARSYFGDLILALQNTFLYDDAAFCLLPRASGPEIVGEVADLLIRCECTRLVFCGAVVGDDLLVSVRTDKGSKNATLLLQATLQGLGSGGGHEHRAGGKIPGCCRTGRITDDLENELRDRWLAACGVDRQRGTRLVARREIVENL